MAEAAGDGAAKRQESRRDTCACDTTDAAAVHLQRRVVDEGKHRWQIQEVGVVMHVAVYALALRLQLGHSDGIQALGEERAVARSL